MSATPLHRVPQSRGLLFAVAIVSGAAASVMAVLAVSLQTMGA